MDLYDNVLLGCRFMLDLASRLEKKIDEETNEVKKLKYLTSLNFMYWSQDIKNMDEHINDIKGLLRNKDTKIEKYKLLHFLGCCYASKWVQLDRSKYDLDKVKKYYRNAYRLKPHDRIKLSIKRIDQRNNIIENAKEYVKQISIETKRLLVRDQYLPSKLLDQLLFDKDIYVCCRAHETWFYKHDNAEKQRVRNNEDDGC